MHLLLRQLRARHDVLDLRGAVEALVHAHRDGRAMSALQVAHRQVLDVSVREVGQHAVHVIARVRAKCDRDFLRPC